MNNSLQLSSLSANDSLSQLNLMPPEDPLLNMTLQSIDDNLENILNISTNNNNETKSIREFLSDFLVDHQQNLNSKIITLLFPYDNPEELFFWAKYATINELLKTPNVDYINER